MVEIEENDKFHLGVKGLRENFSLQYQDNIKHRSDENKVKYQLRDY